jgi:hypothetical protein
VRNDDWIGDSDALLNKLRPSRLRYDVALAVAAIALGLCAVWAAGRIRISASPPYEFSRDGATVYVMDRRSGSVAACQVNETKTVCGEDDSPSRAFVRTLSE